MIVWLRFTTTFSQLGVNISRYERSCIISEGVEMSCVLMCANAISHITKGKEAYSLFIYAC